MAGKKGRRGWGRIRRLPSSKRFQANYVGPDKVRYNASPRSGASSTLRPGWLVNAASSSYPRGRPRRAAAQAATSETVTQYAERWIAERKLSERTRREYESKLRLHITPTPLGGVPIANLTAPMVRAGTPA